jgi:hypothetical protein
MMDGGLRRLVYDDRDDDDPASETEDHARRLHPGLSLAIEPHAVTAAAEDHFFRRGMDEEALKEEDAHLSWTSSEGSSGALAWSIVLLAASVFAATALVLRL